MPYLIAPPITKELPGLWAEGRPYHSELIYDICSTDPKMPPVHYEAHSIKPHSVCHFDAPGHIIPGGPTMSDLLRERSEIFFGPAVVLRLKTPEFRPHPRLPTVQHFEVSKEALQRGLKDLGISSVPNKLLLTFEGDEPDFFRDSTRAMTLSLEAAQWLTSASNFNLLGTIWKSTDFQPGVRERPIHTEIFKQAGVLECLDLSRVPEGEYYLSAFPLPLESATESPVMPVLFTREEIAWRSTI